MIEWLLTKIPFFGKLIQAGLDELEAWRERRKIKTQGKIELEKLKTQAQIELTAKTQTAEIDWDAEAMRQTQFSWKDEWFTVVITLPFLGSFIPVVQDSVLKGWNYLDKAPDWYSYSFIGAVAASFGIRWILGRFSK